LTSKPHRYEMRARNIETHSRIHRVTSLAKKAKPSGDQCARALSVLAAGAAWLCAPSRQRSLR
jgi:prolyl-tRNA editing enzyme YbaK/EbsC (Cys-tRNA(Pro) deacylase)